MEIKNEPNNIKKFNIPTKIKSYKIEKELCLISNSHICLGTNLNIKEKVLIKIYDKERFQNNSEEIHQINNEIFIMRLINHKNVLKLYEIIESPSYIFLIMEYFNTTILNDYIKSKKNFTEDECLNIYKQLISLLLHFREMNIGHLNINPNEIFIDSNNNIKLFDFKYAIYYTTSDKVKCQCINDINFLCPELLSDKSCYPELADIWSSGVLLYLILVGQLPFKGINNYDLQKKIMGAEFVLPLNISENMQDLIKNIFEVKVEERYNLYEILSSDLFKEKKINKNNLSKGFNILSTKYPFDERILNICKTYYNIDIEELKQKLNKNIFDPDSSLYKQIVNKFVNKKISTEIDLCSEKFNNYIGNKKNLFNDNILNNNIKDNSTKLQEIKDNNHKLIESIKEKQTNALIKLDKLIEKYKNIIGKEKEEKEKKEDKKEEIKLKEEIKPKEVIKPKEEIKSKEEIIKSKEEMKKPKEEIKSKELIKPKEVIKPKEDIKPKEEVKIIEQINQKEDIIPKEEVKIIEQINQKEDIIPKEEPKIIEQINQKEDIIPKEEPKIIEQINQKEDIKPKEEKKIIEQINQKENIIPKEETKPKKEIILIEQIKPKEEIKQKEEIMLKEDIKSKEEIKQKEEIKSINQTKQIEQEKPNEEINDIKEIKSKEGQEIEKIEKEKEKNLKENIKQKEESKENMETHLVDKKCSLEKKYKERKSIKNDPKNIDKYIPKENQSNLRKTMPKKVVTKEQKRETQEKTDSININQSKKSNNYKKESKIIIKEIKTKEKKDITKGKNNIIINRPSIIKSSPKNIINNNNKNEEKNLTVNSVPSNKDKKDLKINNIQSKSVKSEKDRKNNNNIIKNTKTETTKEEFFNQIKNVKLKKTPNTYMNPDEIKKKPKEESKNLTSVEYKNITVKNDLQIVEENLKNSQKNENNLLKNHESNNYKKKNIKKSKMNKTGLINKIFNRRSIKNEDLYMFKKKGLMINKNDIKAEKNKDDISRFKYKVQNLNDIIVEEDINEFVFPKDYHTERLIQEKKKNKSEEKRIKRENEEKRRIEIEERKRKEQEEIKLKLLEEEERKRKEIEEEETMRQLEEELERRREEERIRKIKEREEEKKLIEEEKIRKEKEKENKRLEEENKIRKWIEEAKRQKEIEEKKKREAEEMERKEEEEKERKRKEESERKRRELQEENRKRLEEYEKMIKGEEDKRMMKEQLRKKKEEELRKKREMDFKEKMQNININTVIRSNQSESENSSSEDEGEDINMNPLKTNSIKKNNNIELSQMSQQPKNITRFNFFENPFEKYKDEYPDEPIEQKILPRNSVKKKKLSLHVITKKRKTGPKLIDLNKFRESEKYPSEDSSSEEKIVIKSNKNKIEKSNMLKEPKRNSIKSKKYYQQFTNFFFYTNIYNIVNDINKEKKTNEIKQKRLSKVKKNNLYYHYQHNQGKTEQYSFYENSFQTKKRNLNISFEKRINNSYINNDNIKESNKKKNNIITNNIKPFKMKIRTNIIKSNEIQNINTDYNTNKIEKNIKKKARLNTKTEFVRITELTKQNENKENINKNKYLNSNEMHYTLDPESIEYFSKSLLSNSNKTNKNRKKIHFSNISEFDSINLNKSMIRIKPNKHIFKENIIDLDLNIYKGEINYNNVSTKNFEQALIDLMNKYKKKGYTCVKKNKTKFKFVKGPNIHNVEIMRLGNGLLYFNITKN